MPEKVTLVFADADPTDATDIGHFLFLFRAVYAAAVPALADRSASAVDAEALFDEMQAVLRGTSLKDVSSLFTTDLGTARLIAERIGRQSPLTIVFIGVLIAIVAAAILSGGKLKLGIGSIEANLPPIGEGIRRLKDALTRSDVSLSYGPRVREIQLSKEEATELLRHSPEGRGQGGFQNLLTDLQRRFNSRTKKLFLLEQDIDRVFRYGRNRGKGGWQASIQKIFGRHFDFKS